MLWMADDVDVALRIRSEPAAAARLELAWPMNPFAAVAYLQARTAMGDDAWVLMDRERVAPVCAAFLRAGRLHRTLMIPSVPPCSASYNSGQTSGDSVFTSACHGSD